MAKTVLRLWKKAQCGGKTANISGDKMPSNEDLYNQLNRLSTEQRNPQSTDIDLSDSLEIVSLINSEDKSVAYAVQQKLPIIAEAIDCIADKLSKGGRLLYFGAGTSGRLGVLDAAECPPTFGTDPSMVQGFIAGGEQAMFVAQEGAEDDPENGKIAVKEINVTGKDIVVGIAASGRTPYVHGAMAEAHNLGAKTVFLTTVSSDQIEKSLTVNFMIDIPVGPEVIMGSTRMKSATAQKMVLNMLSTGAMVRLGKIYENVMVDLKLTNRKLEERAKRIISFFCNCSYKEAESVLDEADNHVKTALVMKLKGISKEKAIHQLNSEQGFIRKVLMN